MPTRVEVDAHATPQLSHARVSSIPGLSNGCCYLSKSPPTTAVVFVHGFNGDHTSATWGQFGPLLLSSDKTVHSDIFFYKYDGVDDHAAHSAQALFDFLCQLADGIEIQDANLYGIQARDETCRYGRILLVAHSLGALVSRLALVRAEKLGERRLHSARLVLFAPAHAGADLLQLAAEFEFLKIAEAALAAAGKCAVLKDLRHDSDAVVKLREDTVMLLKQPDTHCLAAICVVHGARDQVVPVADYLDDHPLESIALGTHRGVCKPSGRVDRIFKAVEALL